MKSFSLKVFLLLLVSVCGSFAPQAFSSSQGVKQIIQIANEFYKDFPESSRVLKFQLIPATRMPAVKDLVNHVTRKAHGFCHTGYMTVGINADWWAAEKNIWKKRKLIYHELAHCSLGLRHPKVPTTLTIMNHDINLVTEGKDWPALVKELKRRVK